MDQAIKEIAPILLIFGIGWGVGSVINKFSQHFFLGSLLLMLLFFMIREPRIFGFRGEFLINWAAIENLVKQLETWILQMDTLEQMALVTGLLKGMSVFTGFGSLLKFGKKK